jgi:hypothetical protein
VSISLQCYRFFVTAICELIALPAIAQIEQRSAAIVENSPVPPVADQRPFTATFSNGVKVQLIGLSENPSRGNAWWAPDGTRLDKPPYAHVRAHIQARQGQLAREICWRWIDTPEDPNFETSWQVTPGAFASGGGRALDDQGKQVPDIAAWAVGLATSKDTCSVRFSASIGATPWTTDFTLDDARSASMSRNDGGQQRGVIFAEPRAERGGTSITVSYLIPEKAVRLIAVDRDGLIDEATSTGGSVFNFTQKTYRFANLPPDKIDRFELQSQKREFETVEFRNVSLNPNKPTKVEIVRLSAEEAARAPGEDPKKAAK